MGLSLGGLQSAVAGAAATVANLVGQVVTALQFVSSQASGSDAFKAATGARWHFGAGASDYASSDGTTVTFAGPVNISGQVSLDNAGNTLLTGASAQIAFVADNAASGRITSSQTAATTSTTVAALKLFPQNVLDATDLVLRVGDAANANSLFNVNYSGQIAPAADLSFPSYTDDSATPGNRTVNKVRGKNAIAIGASTCVITNSFVTANSQVICVLEFADATATFIKCCIPAAGSFTLTVNANATAATKFSWLVIN
jgi:hypothetical protein